MSACEITTIDGFESLVNRRRRELDCNEYFGFRVGQFVTDGSNVFRIIRFIEAGTIPCADIRKWVDNSSSPIKKLLRQVELFNEETANYKPCDDPRKET